MRARKEDQGDWSDPRRDSQRRHPKWQVPQTQGFITEAAVHISQESH